MPKPLYDIRDNADTNKIDVVRLNEAGDVLEVCDSFDTREAAIEEIDEYEQAWCEEQEARRMGDDPRFDPPDDPHAYQNELAEQWRDFVRNETEE